MFAKPQPFVILGFIILPGPRVYKSRVRVRVRVRV